MKLNTNFVTSSLKVTSVFGMIMLGAALFFFILSFVLIIDHQQMSDDINILVSENKKLNLQVNSFLKQNNHALPSMSELQKLAQNVEVLNTASAIKGDSISTLLTQLEIALPKDTYLKSLVHHPKKGEMLITAVSLKSNLLTDFLRQLEKDSHFERVMLVRQSKNGNNKNEVQFDLRLLVSQ